MRLALRRRILIGYGIATGLTAVVLGWGLVSLMHLGQASNAILRENYHSILAAERMLDAIHSHETGVLLLILGKRAEAIRRCNESQAQFLLYLARAKENITIQGEADILQEIEREHDTYSYEFTAFSHAQHDQASDGFSKYERDLLPHALAIRKACRRLHDLNQSTMECGSGRAHRVAQTAFWSMLAVGGAAVAVGIGFSLLLSARIIRPVRQLMQATEQVATGDYQTRIIPESQDEFGQLAETFNLMVAKLRAFNDLNVGQVVAEKKKSEAILRSIHDGVLLVDSKRKVTSMNPAAARVLKRQGSNGEERELARLIPDQRLLACVDEALRTGRAVSMAKGDNFFSVQEGASQVYYEYAITPVQQSPGIMLGVVVLLHDITKLKEFDRMKNEFVMTASHELRTPLTSIGMSIELLRERAKEKFDACDGELLDAAHEEVTRLKRLVDELLDLTRIESGKIELHFAPVSLNTLLEAALLPFQSQAEEKSVQLALQLAEDLPRVQADASKLTLVMTNLIGNALRYTRPGGHIWVSDETAGPWVHVYVRDDGTGMSEELQSKIFDRFIQFDGAGQAGGAGLGLAIAKEIVRAHNGSIWVESEPGKGTLFTVALPALKSHLLGEES